MSISEILHRKPAVTISLCAAAVVVLVVLTVSRMHATPRTETQSGNIYFSADDGATYAPADGWQIPPYTDPSGKVWVRAYVFDSHGKPFVGYLEKYLPQAYDRLKQADGRGRLNSLMNELENDLVVKKPGQGDWVQRVSPEGAAIIHVTGPEGGPVKPVLPP